MGKARLVWNLLSPTSNILTPTQCRIDFYQAFVHLNQGSQKELPHHVPIGIRAKFHCDPCSARLKYLSISKGKQELSNDDMKKINSWIYGPSNDHIQGQRLVTMLECALEDGGPILALTYLNVLMKQPHPHRKIDGLTGLTHVCEEQLSNMLATYVRSFRVRMSNWSEVKIYENIDFLSKVLMISERTPSIWANEASRFKRTIGKLEGVEVSLCLWLFISSWRCRNVYEVSALFDIMRDHYAQTFPEGVQLYHLHLAGKPENEVVINVVAFLCSVTEKRRLSPFFSDLYNAMVQCIGAHSFLQAWEAMHESDLYERQIDLLYERQKCERLMGETAEEFMRIIHSSDES